MTPHESRAMCFIRSAERQLGLSRDEPLEWYRANRPALWALACLHSTVPKGRAA